ncbi:MAG: ABC transporter substrate-binding protein [Ignavibacteria bacterium]|nr:ABC transporter substrate-binding protein [Ignavibacteria bacterium]
MKKFPLTLLQTLLLVLTLNIYSCSDKKETDSKVFTINVSQNIETLEPVMSNSNQTIWGLSVMMEGLVEFDKENNIKPSIARNWEITDDALTYTFHLRDDVYYHDNECFKETNGKGRKVTAQDFKYCFERVNNPKTKTRGQWVYRDRIKGAQEYIDFMSGKSTEEVNGISGLQAPDDSTLVIELTKPFAPFLSVLTMSYGYVYPREAVEFYGDRFGQNPVGTGPFRFVKWDLDKELVFEKNKNYREKDKDGNAIPYLDGVRFTFTQSSETEFMDFQNGRYDYHDPSSETYDQITDDNGNLIDSQKDLYTLNRQPWLQTVFFGMMQSPELPGGKAGPFVNNLKLRQALNYAVDRDRILKFVLKNRGSSAENGPLPKGMPGFNPEIKGYKYDKDKAMQLLKEAGYPNGEGLDLTLVTGNEEIQKTLAIAVQQQLKDIGIDLKLDQMIQATLISKQEEGVFPFWRASWGADYYDPENFMALFYSKNITPNGPNRVGYSNPDVDRLYEEALKITDFEERKKIYDQMQKIVIEDAAWLFLYYNQKVYLLKKNVEGFYVDGLNIINLKYAKKN